ncbi:MAG: homocysteine S-methyltransferase family protein [Candidatus Eisenbacteria bacterium]|nr:homocysteine S-methyltransferase family protein [Candidatus Eisenbacteria bacterium]
MRIGKNLLDELTYRVLVCDGATGTRIQELGVLQDESIEYTSILRPDLVRRVHSEYIDAGADLIETNTYRANEFMLAKHGLQRRVEEMNRISAWIAVEAAGNRAYVLGSVGPTGRLMTPIGDLHFKDAYNAFKTQISSLVIGGVDGIIIETMYDLRELKAALLALKDTAPGIPRICQMSFNEDGRTSLGTDSLSCATVVEGMDADVIGANCSVGPASLVRVLHEMAEITGNFLSVQPNAGFPTKKAGKIFYPATPEYVASFVKNFVDEGVSIIGGCCGTNPSHIREIAAKVRAMKPVTRKVSELFKLSGRTRAFMGGGGKRPMVIGTAIGALSGEGSKYDLEARRLLTVQSLATRQVEFGADVLLVGVPQEAPESAELVKKILTLIQNAVPNPLALKTRSPKGLETVLESIEGKALLIVETRDPSDLKEILSLAKRFGLSVALPWEEGRSGGIMTILRETGFRQNDSIFLIEADSSSKLTHKLGEARKAGAHAAVGIGALLNLCGAAGTSEILKAGGATAVFANTEVEQERSVLRAVL